MIEQAIQSLWAFVVFAFVILGIYDAALLVLLFLGLAIRGIWRWLSRSSWNDVVILIDRKAFRR